ncbi:PilZ domain-containing protein [Pleionea litopenaei]|uniref:PilZ domain-containing protein n=1 Tax=Pleionea litopenaei TaxID=3070815 RepID=A0AA51RVA0_9GAMM|nr:PilZ domain-containing protein [Pleionea sp. HL-JVS1]WMS88144.1 PilZ domain-containing protein [Pleionea sp. HL-JVS1]
MSIEREYEEKRDFIRMFVDAKVEITDPNTGDHFIGDSKNLSAGGVAFLCDHSFEVGQTLEVKVSSVQSQLPPLTAELKVIRSDKRDDGQYEVAGSIANVN